MAITINAKGTSVPYFKIGKGGTTIFQGSADPALEHTVNNNDVWLDSNNAAVKYRVSGQWVQGGAYNTTNFNTDFASKDTDDLVEGTSNLYFTDSRARAAISVSGDLAYNNTTGVISYTTPSIPSDVSELTDTTGLLTHFSGEYADLANAPTTVSSFTNDAGYLTSFTETDPIFTASPAAGITSGLINQWNTAYSWGDHSIVGYLTSETETYSTATELLTAIKTVDGIGSLLDSDLLDGQEGIYYLNYTNFTNTPTIPSTTDDISEAANLYYTSARATSDARSAISVSGDLSYNSSTGVISYTAPTNVSSFANDAGYITSVAINDISDVSISTPASGQVLAFNGTNWVNSSTNSANWDTAYSWGDHATVGYLTSETYSTATELLNALKTVDGTTSGLDADLWDGRQFITYLDQSVKTTSDVQFNNVIANDITVGGILYSDDITATDVTISGNLTVSGSVVTVNTEVVTIADNIILLNSNQVAAPTVNAGIEIERGTEFNALFVWDETNDRWSFGANDVYTSGNVISNFAGNVVSLSTIDTDNLPEGGSNLYYTDARVDARIALNETNDYVNSATFSILNGILTLGRTDGGNVTVDLDGRYLLSSDYIDTNEYVDGISFNSLTGVVTLSRSGSLSDLTVDLDGRYLLSSDYVDTNTYLSSMNFNVTSGVLTATLSDTSTVTVDLDGRYSQTDTTYTAGDGLTLTGTTFSVNVDGGLEIDINDDIVISNTTVSAGSYGAADSVSTFTVNTKGQLTSAGVIPIEITASQVSDFSDGVKAAMAMTHTGVYYVTASDEITNAGVNYPISANTIGFNLAGKEIYMVYLNRLLLRPSEYAVDPSTGTITFQQGLLAQNDEIEAVYYG